MAAKKKPTPTTPAEAKAQLAEELAAPPAEHDGHTISVGVPDDDPMMEMIDALADTHVETDIFVNEVAPLPTYDEIQADAVEQNAKLGDALVAALAQRDEASARADKLEAMVGSLIDERDALRAEIARLAKGSTKEHYEGQDYLREEPVTVDDETPERRAVRLEGRAAELQAFRYEVESEIGRLNTEARAARIEHQASVR